MKTGQKILFENEILTIIELENEKQELLLEVNQLVSLKNKLYSNIDITTKMTENEKQLNNKISNIYSRINEIVKLKRKIK